MENRKVKINNNISETRNQSEPDNDVATSLSRPASYYDNIGGSSSLPANGVKTNEDDRTATLNSNGRSSQNYSLTNGTVTSAKTTVPTQTVLLNTTVPQNIAATANLATRHTPTRNSLRHSRMIVMTRTGKVSRKFMPKIMRYHRLAKALVSLQTILASALCFLAMWLLMWAPNLKTRDNPYWSAIPLLISGILGLVLLCCCRKEYPGMPNEYSVITTKVFSIIITTISGAVCLIAAAFAIIHLVSLSVMICSPPNQSNSTCFCKVTIDSYHYNQSVSPLIKSYHYMDLTCPEVDNVLTILLICSGVVNAVSGIIALWYVYLHWASRYYYTYSKVRTKENKPIILTNA